MGFNYEWKNSMEGDCIVKVSFFNTMKNKSVQVNIKSLCEVFDNLQSVLNVYDTEKYSEEQLDNFQAQYDVLLEFFEILNTEEDD